MFVLITSIAPVRAFLSIQGLARLCATQYELPTDQNLHNAQMHLTNYAVNKPGSDRAEADCAPQTHAVKRTLMDVFQVVGEQPPAPGHDGGILWQRLQKLVSSTVRVCVLARAARIDASLIFRAPLRLRRSWPSLRR